MKNLFNKIITSRWGAILLLIVLLVINFVASIVHSRIDLTKEKRYTLSKATRNLLVGLDDDVQINVFLKGDFPAGFRKLANSTDEFLQLLKDKKFQEAVLEFRGALQIDEKLADAHWGLANALEGLQRYQEAFEEMRQTADLDWTVCQGMEDLESPRVRERLEDLGLQDRDLVHAHDYRHMRRS